MRLTIAEALQHVQSKQPVPVIFIDTCSFLDLFRADERQPRADYREIRDAAALLLLASKTPEAVHLIVPELVPREFADHADAIQTQFGKWTVIQDENQQWLFEVSAHVAVPAPKNQPIHPLDLAARLRTLADNLLSQAIVLEREQICLDRAVHRLIHKQRPSQSKEMKDSMNLEQCLELSRLLESIAFPKSRVWVSSNIRDFAAPNSTQLHPDLAGDFANAGLKYFASLRAALGHLRANFEI